MIGACRARVQAEPIRAVRLQHKGPAIFDGDHAARRLDAPVLRQRALIKELAVLRDAHARGLLPPEEGERQQREQGDERNDGDVELLDGLHNFIINFPFTEGKATIRIMERIDDLQFRGLKIIQDDEASCFTEDAVLLANYLRAGPRDRVVDLGAGGGLISILAEAKTGAKFVGIEKQAKLVDLARRSAAMNGQAIDFCEMDVRDAPRQFGHGCFTAAVSNPPYFDALEDCGQSEGRALARHGGAALLDAFLEAAFLLLKNGGKLYMCWPVSGLTDALCLLRARRLEPKALRLVCQGQEPRLALITAKKLGKSGLKLSLANQ